MNNLFGSWIVKIIALVAGFFSAIATGRLVSVTFDYYLGLNMGSWLKTYSPAPVFLFIVCMTVFILSVFISKGPSRFYNIRRVDWTLLVVLVISVIVFSVFLLRDGTMFTFLYQVPVSIQLIIISMVLYVIAMALVYEIMARIRDRQLLATLYWIKFFRLYPVSKLSGFLMAVLLVGNLWLIFAYCVPGIIGSRGYLYLQTIPLFIFSVFIFAALTYFCAFVLSLSDRYEKANEEKVRSERLKAELITNVSHDIRTPLTTIINYVDLLKKQPAPNEEFAEYLSVLDKKTARLKTLIGDLIEASKAGTGNIQVEVKEINLSEIVGQVVGDFDEMFSSRELILVMRGTDKPVPAQADSRYLWRALENLFGNAAKYAMPGTRVFAEIQKLEGYVALSIKNTSNIPLDLPGKELAEQFMRGDRARKTEGSGLGLYIAKSLVELMGGYFIIQTSGDLFEVEIRLPSL